MGDEVTLKIVVPARVEAGLRALAARAGVDGLETFVAGLLAGLVASAETGLDWEDHLREVRELEARLRSLGYID